MNKLFVIYSIVFIILFVLFFSFLYIYNLYSGLKNKIVGGVIKSSTNGYTIELKNVPSITTPTSSMSIWLNIKNTETTNSEYIHLFCFSKTQSVIPIEATPTETPYTIIYSLNIRKNTSILSFCPYFVNQADFNDNNLKITNNIPYDKWVNIFINIKNNKIFEFYINGKLEQTYNMDMNISTVINSIHSHNLIQYCVMLKPKNDTDCSKFDISVANFQRWLYNQNPDQIMKIYNAGIGFQLPLWNAGITYLYHDKVIQRLNLFETRDLSSVML